MDKDSNHLGTNAHSVSAKDCQEVFRMQSHVYHFMHFSLTSDPFILVLSPLNQHATSKMNNNQQYLGLPLWLSGKESTCQCRRHRFDPWPRKIAQATVPPSLLATTIKPVLKSPGAATSDPTCWNYWSHCSLEPTLQNKRSLSVRSTTTRDELLLTTTREKPVQQQRPSTDKINNLIKKNT